MFQAMPNVAHKISIINDNKKYNDSFEFCYNQKKNKKIRLMILEKYRIKYY